MTGVFGKSYLSCRLGVNVGLGFFVACVEECVGVCQQESIAAKGLLHPSVTNIPRTAYPSWMFRTER